MPYGIVEERATKRFTHPVGTPLGRVELLAISVLLSVDDAPRQRFPPRALALPRKTYLANIIVFPKWNT